jgi:rootletin
MFQVKLEEQEEKSNTLSEVNSVLRDQLDKAVDNNSNLIEDLKRLASDWEKLNRELVDRVSDMCFFVSHNFFIVSDLN